LIASVQQQAIFHGAEFRDLAGSSSANLLCQIAVNLPKLTRNTS
jgi:hypothetical protein